MVVGIFTGEFDLYNFGDVIELKECKDMCDTLLVLVKNGPAREDGSRWVQSYTERVGQVWANRCVDRVIVYTSLDEYLQLIKSIKPDKIFISSRYKGKKESIPEPDKVVFLTREVPYYDAELKCRVLYDASDEQIIDQAVNRKLIDVT